jgi:ribosomal protein S18 acetylase RimI-like enzyme
MLIRRLVPADAHAFQVLRLNGLRECAPAFSSSYEEECDTPIATIEQNLAERMMFGAFDGPWMAGMVGVGREPMRNLRHKAFIRSMYVAPTHRGQGLGRKLMLHAFQAAASMDGVTQVTLEVTAGQEPAIALYESLGYVAYGLEKRALRIDGVFYDEIRMARDVPSAA